MYTYEISLFLMAVNAGLVLYMQYSDKFLHTLKHYKIDEDMQYKYWNSITSMIFVLYCGWALAVNVLGLGNLVSLGTALVYTAVNVYLVYRPKQYLLLFHPVTIMPVTFMFVLSWFL